MLIDWFTLGAQALNFLVLVWLLKRFLYRPILDAIDIREKRIASEIADANAKRDEAQKEKEEFQRKNEEFDRQRAELLGKAAEEAKRERQGLLDAARKEAEDLTAKRREALTHEAKDLNRALRLRTQQEVFSISRKTLADLADTTLEERLVEVFISRLRTMDGKEKEDIAKSLGATSANALLRSAFDLSTEQHATLQNALNEAFSTATSIRFETFPELIGGIEFSVSGKKMAWSIPDYLASMEEGVGELLEDKAESQPPSKSR
ncbi:ATP synthase F0 subcomplex B subunit [Verrucomicrobium sp. GAS474]|uniref:F0F1 ATP synthase subunit B family protein n=1 Tax=Verrucomicrobium sp. GAS474 TaxID=1882831 RepID=UPI00087CF254|nr:F0F1 ATP synthase subunit delta [Verrucomicrobium sp. GAS474]SDU19061.1 ATP synthase F0 subcomplex B subunit [Verrucomicrobium sp. GAS474]